MRGKILLLLNMLGNSICWQCRKEKEDEDNNNNFIFNYFLYFYYKLKIIKLIFSMCLLVRMNIY